MTDRPLLSLPNPRSTDRLRRSRVSIPRLNGFGHEEQSDRYGTLFNQLEAALQLNQGLELRRDPLGIAPERALVFVTAEPISNFIQAARKIDLKILLEFDLGEDYEFSDELIFQVGEKPKPTLYATIPTSEILQEIIRLWKRYNQNKDADTGYTPWWKLFDLLSELRAWGPNDRLTQESCRELEARLPENNDDEVVLELECWPEIRKHIASQWRQDSEIKVVEMGGRIIDRSSIHDGSFEYEALLVGLPAKLVRQLIQNPSMPDSLATLDGIKFILPQTLGQALPSKIHPPNVHFSQLREFNQDAPIRALLLDGTPVAQHPAISGGLVIEDPHNLVQRSIVSNRKHATEMASLILRGNLKSDGMPLINSRVLSIPLLIDTEKNSTSPNDRLFIDLVHTALQRVFEGESPLAPDIFVINFSIGVIGSHFSGRISSLARLLDWWSFKAGILFVVSAGNVGSDLIIKDINFSRFEDLSVPERQSLVRDAQRLHRTQRTLLPPSEALNVITIGAASLDLSSSTVDQASRSVPINPEGEILPAISSATGLGPFRCIKPDLIAVGGHHEVRSIPKGNDVGLNVRYQSNQSGLFVASTGQEFDSLSRTRGTSSAAALVTRSVLMAADVLTGKRGPYENIDLSRTDLALLTKALAINSANRIKSMESFYDSELQRLGSNRYQHANEEVARYFGNGFLDSSLMWESPLNGATLVGLGQVQKDQGLVFDIPLPPSMSKDTVGRSMNVTLAWFSPVNPSRAKYRLASLEAVVADDSLRKYKDKDTEWRLGMKPAYFSKSMIGRGTVWSRRLIHKRKTVSEFSNDATLPLRVECRDASGGGLDPDLPIRFALVITLKLETQVQYDIYQEIRNRLMVRLK